MIKAARNTAILFFIAIGTLELPLFACASCSSGADEPLILYPNEKAKIYLGFTQRSGNEALGADGTEFTRSKIDTQRQVLYSAGFSLGTRSFFSFSLPWLENSSADKSVSSHGDPSVAARYTIVLQSIADPLWIPQVQAVLGYKKSVSPSMHSVSPENFDVTETFGTGFDDIRTGLDVWYGLYAFKAGGSWIVVQPQPARYHERQIAPGTRHLRTYTVSFSPPHTQLRVTTGATDLFSTQRRDNGVEIEGTEQVSHGLFLTAEYKVNRTTHMRLSVTDQANLGDNQNTARFKSFTGAYIFSL
jgi:hypothetical protein